MSNKACKFCSEHPNSLLLGTILTGDGAAALTGVAIEENHLVLSTEKNSEIDSMVIEHCPMCGRKLEW
ncbi:hypothetical protein [Loigolactobacillus rennini]|uniref:hypothetical protein n=1 Tax=Loigolactobacillus rennini TaxID=238013 RepID=UPI00070B0782|nr:hypothetical protein [Loigolactobacillus rennini]